jgi:mono/diheme cytochrome c family protein
MSRRFPYLALLWVVALLGGCEKGWRTDMWYQPAHRPEDSPRPEPALSVPLGARAPLSDRDAAVELVNPVAGDTTALRHGQMLFVQRCLPCHGAAGNGGGPVSKYFPPAPDLAETTIKGRSDGYLFGTIIFGGRAMPAQGDGLTERDRWDLVDAVRGIQAGASGAAP